MWSPQSPFDLLWKKSFQMSWEEFIEVYSYWRSLFWNSITVLKLLRTLIKFSTRSSDHLHLVFKSIPAAATCSCVLLAILFFIELLRIRILLFQFYFISIYACASSSIDLAEWLHETSWLGHPSWLAFQKRQLAFSSPHVIVKQFQQGWLLIAMLVLKWRKIAYRATIEPAHLM